MTKKTSIKLFENKKICTLWDSENEKWYISIVNVFEMLIECIHPASCWCKLKQCLKEKKMQQN